MINKFICCVIGLTLFGCSKDNSPAPIVYTPTPIDLSAQWTIGNNNNVLTSTNDLQWQKQAFNTVEMKLFQVLDTAVLVGLDAPLAILKSYQPIYPNPIAVNSQFQFYFTLGYAGPITFKYAIVDSLSLPLEQNAVRFNAKAFSAESSGHVNIITSVPKGLYRIYYSLSTKNAPNFYTAWGNINKN